MGDYEVSGAQGERPAEDSAEDYAALVRGLLDDLDGTSITRLDLRTGDLRVSLRRLPGAVGPARVHAVVEEAADTAGRPSHWHAVEAPLTGIFYNRPSPNDEPYVHVGSLVEPDHVVGLIESMKMFNEVTADASGIVREALVENGALIEAGQPILYVAPDGEPEVDATAGL